MPERMPTETTNLDRYDRSIFHTGFGVATTEPNGATRWRLAGA